MIDVVKRYPGVLANDHVNLDVNKGEIHAVMGENGAGKSTLMAILYGLQSPDEGYIRIDWKTVFFRSPIDAIDHGIGMVHQSFKLFESLSVWENVVYGREPRRGPFIDAAESRRQVAALSERHGLPIDPMARVGSLPVGVRQRLEILKALYRHVRVLILDEPTAVLTPGEVAGLFKVLRTLAAAGCAILLVTHKLNEAMAVSDRITVLRDGRVTERLVTAQTNPAQIVRAMTGRNLSLDVPPAGPHPGAVRLELNQLVVGGQNRRAVNEVSFTLRGGEVLGIAGVAGNGQSELVEAIMGMRPCAGGYIVLNGRDITRRSIAERRAAGVSYIAEDRIRTASAAGASATDNLAFGFHRRPPIAVRGLLRIREMRAWARTLIRKFEIKIASEMTRVGTLSGGNLQKIVIARERDRGHAILLVSAELSEILALADRILVMYEGRVIATLDRAEANESILGLYMAGGEQKAS